MHRTAARVTGALFITATVAGVISAALLGGGTGGGAHRQSAGALAVLVMAGAIAMIPAALFPVLKVYSESSAVGYVVARTVEVVLLLPAAFGPLILVAAGDGGLDPAVRSVLDTQDTWGYAPAALFFCLSALLLNVVLFRSRLVPRWLPGWALAGVALYVTDAGLVMFGGLTTASPAHAALVVPLAVNEMVLAVWLLVKGFRTPTG
ncbi:DUF4386 domain-containing protein [Dactylosporangium sp. NPDC006015]|uniref:DUF4386 domain-containing protein n=1 Tax=unclassified Dactylosporangium TaxID=2621675 RepID=UPI0033BB3895